MVDSVNSRFLPGLLIVLACSLATAQDTRPTNAAEDANSRQAKPTLDDELSDLLDELLHGTRDPRSSQDVVWRTSLTKHGTIKPVLDELARRMALKAAKRAHTLNAIRLSSRLLRRLGELRQSRRMLEKIERTEESVADCLSLAEVLDAGGDVDESLEVYDRLLALEIDEALRNRVLLRQALMRKSEKKEEPSPLARFASVDGRDAELRNRAAIILALRDEQKDAIKLFEVRAEGKKRYRQEVRLAEWAIEAELWKEAQDFAWRACRSARMKRDRRYALTILVETYRRDNALEALLEKLSKEPDLDNESRQVWIDLLRETGRVEEALRLFRASTGGQFTVDMRRELLEMCRETGQEAVLVDAYGQMIAEELRFLEWREGLSRFHLEHGNRPAALKVWQTYLSVTDDPRYVMAAAATLRNLGLDDLAIAFARQVKGSPAVKDNALLFLFELHRDRGRLEKARTVLDELDRQAAPDASVRKELSDAFTRLGDKKRAVDVLQALRKARGAEVSPDLEMRLALMLSEIDEEEKALDSWYLLWRKTNSIPRRRYVEDRLMTVASRLGKLARIAVDLERKLAAGNADDRDSGLLVRLYTKVNDPVSATEVIEEYMSRSGGKRVEMLAEKARIFQSCNDFFNYEAVIRELISTDPENRPDYLRQLAMSNLERGQRDEARVILEQLKGEEGDTASDEFEAGVLSLAGMREEAIQAYMRGIGRHPERIDSYLLLSNVMKELGQHERSAGMFQYLAATAEKDDLFTIAIDGILNMRDGRTNRGAPDRLVEWARRLVLERVARRPNKFYLYQLVADLSDEVNDKGMSIRALKAALPIAGEQRTQLLRELMSMSRASSRSSSSIVFFSPSISARRGGNRNFSVNTQQLMFGRRLMGQGELVPPQVYLDLGEAFLAAGEVVNATKTFNQASQLPEFAELQRKIAAAFESARYPKEALRVYERILSTETSDISLMVKVAELHEQLGRDDLALDLYRRGLDLFLGGRPFSTTHAKKGRDKPIRMFGAGNVDAAELEYEWLVRGYLATASVGEAYDAYLEEVRKHLDADLQRYAQEDKPEKATLGHYPRLEKRAGFFRRLTIAVGEVNRVDDFDLGLLQAFPADDKLLEKLVRHRLSWGFVLSARKLIDSSGRSDEVKARLRLLAGGSRAEDVPGVVSVGEAAGLFLPLIADGNRDAARMLLERLDLSTGDKADLDHMPLLVSTAAFLKDSEQSLTLCRHWLNLLVRHSGKSLYGPVQDLLRQSQRVLDKPQQKSLMESLIDMVVEKPDQFSIFISRLPRLIEDLGEDLITSEKVQKLIQSRLSANDRFIYGIPDLFILIPAPERAQVLRSIWPKVPKTQRTVFLLDLLPKLDTKVDAGFAEFLTGSLESSFKDADHKDTLVYRVDNLVEGSGANLEIALRFVEILKKADPKQPGYQAQYALGLLKLGRKEQAVKCALEAMRALLASSKQEYRVTAAINQITEAFVKDHHDQFLAILDDLEKRGGKTVNLTNRRLNFIARQNDDKTLLDALHLAVEDHPKDVSLRQRLKRQLRSLGYRIAAVGVQEDIVNLEPKKARQRDVLVREWRSLRNPVKALAARDADKKKKDEKTPPPVHRKERTPGATVALVKKALDAGEEAQARIAFRRLWRVFPDRSNQYFRLNLGYMFDRRFYWPPDRKKPKTKAKRSRGGLPTRFTTAPKKDQERKKPKPAKKRPTAHEVLVGKSFGQDEIRRQLRSLDAAQLDSTLAADIWTALTKLEVQKTGREAAIDRLLALEKAGMAGKKEYGMLFSLLEQSTADTGADVSTMLAGLMKNLNSSDTAQLRRMARMYARLDEGGKASILYQWCAIREGGRNFYGAASDLLNDVIENLKGAHRDEAVSAILAFSEPDPTYFYGLDGYENLVLTTWVRLLGPEGALAKVRPLCEEITKLGQMPRRRAAGTAAWLLARAGEEDLALACLEVALCKLEIPGNLEFPHYATYFTNPGHLSDPVIQKLFPKDFDGWAGPSAWLEKATQRIRAWSEAGRMGEHYAFRLLAVLALRLHEVGNEQAAATAFEQARTLAQSDVSQLLWVIDIARLIGRTEYADATERQLLDEGRLHIERVPEVVDRVKQAEGAELAFTLGEKAAEYTLHPDLLDLLVSSAEEIGKPDRAQHWKTVKQGAEEATAALDEKKN